MAILIEAISVVIRVETLFARFPGGWEAFCTLVPNSTLCSDNELVRVGFMVPADVEAFVKRLEAEGLVYVVNGDAQDLVVVDQLRGPMANCGWIEFGWINLDGDTKRRVAAARLVGGSERKLWMPEGWRWEESLSRQFAFVPDGAQERSLTFLRYDNGLDVYFNRLAGKEVYVGRSASGVRMPPSS
jgi:hypothetical protein